MTKEDILNGYTEVRHVKSGGVYRVIFADAKLEWDETPAVVYGRISEDEQHDLQVWVRPASEFFDGRFVLCEEATV